MTEKLSHEPKNDIDLLDEDAQEVFGNAPSWLLHWGIPIVLLLLICVVVFSIFFKYKDSVSAPVTLISENPAVEIYSKIEGNISELLVKDNEKVAKGQYLAVIGNTVNIQEVQDLKQKLEKVFVNISLGKKDINYLNIACSLGEITNVYAELCDAYNRVVLLERDDKMLVAVSKRWVYQTEIQRLSKQKIGGTDSIKILEKKISANDIVLSSYHGKELKQVTELLRTLDLKLKLVKASMQNWENTFAIISPIEGRVIFNDVWAVQQYIRKEKCIFIVAPVIKSGVIGQIRLKVVDGAKVAIGQNVLISLNDYPAMDYGYLKGIVRTISRVPQKDQNEQYYTVFISLPIGLQTDRNHMIKFDQFLSGTAEIISKDQSIFNRILKSY